MTFVAMIPPSPSHETIELSSLAEIRALSSATTARSRPALVKRLSSEA